MATTLVGELDALRRQALLFIAFYYATAALTAQADHLRHQKRSTARIREALSSETANI